MTAEGRPRVLVTRRLPQEALDRIEARCDLTLHQGDDPMARDLLLTEVSGKPGVITLLTERVDDEFLDVDEIIRAAPEFAGEPVATGS